eukprot:scaffold114855_cov47-Prasinocladus_malaysianus.AAC.1
MCSGVRSQYAVYALALHDEYGRTGLSPAGDAQRIHYTRYPSIVNTPRTRAYTRTSFCRNRYSYSYSCSVYLRVLVRVSSEDNQ